MGDLVLIAAITGLASRTTTGDEREHRYVVCSRFGGEPAVRELLDGSDDVRYVWRHLPPIDVHPHAQLAAEATEAACEHGRFWEMHDLLLAHQNHLQGKDLVRYANQLGLDIDRFRDDLRHHSRATRIVDDVENAALHIT